MQTIGDHFREGREVLGISLEEISKRTCINIYQLDALETNRLERLPGGLYNISFARQYARELGLNEDEVAARIKDAMGLPVQSLSKMSVGRAGFSIEEPTAKLAKWTSGFFRKYGGSTISALIAIGLIGGGLYAYHLTEQEELATDTVAEIVAMVQQVSEPAVAVQRQPEAPIELTLEVIETVWVRAVVDGKRLFEETLSQGVVRPIVAQEQVKLKVGNAGGLLLSLNGEDLPAIGLRGQVRSLTVTPTGVEQEEPTIVSRAVLLRAVPRPLHR
jgi:cytoskeletal protein RodZ